MATFHEAKKQKGKSLFNIEILNIFTISIASWMELYFGGYDVNEL